MIKKLTQDKVGLILEYLKAHFSNCIYLYIDLKKYGVTHPEVLFWYSEADGDPNTVIMKYYNSFQIFSADKDWKPDEYAAFIAQHSVLTISGNIEVIRKLDKHLRGFKTAYGLVIHEKKYKEFPQFSLVSKADAHDALEIARLMCSDQEFGENYTVENLSRQLADRILENAGRSYILRENDRIVAHVGTFIEDETMVVESGLIVDRTFKNKFYGLIIHEYLKKTMIEEGKNVYAFRINEHMQSYTKAGNDDICGYYGKMTRSEENA